MVLLYTLLLLFYSFYAPGYSQNTMTQQTTHVKDQSGFTLDEDPFMQAAQEHDLINFFLRPVNFTPDGLTSYFKYTYNHSQYAEHLSYNLAHMIQFLEYGEKHNQDTGFALSVIKLFMQKIKASPFIDGKSFLITIPHLTDVLKFYTKKKDATFLDGMKSKLKEHMTNIFSKYFSYFQSNPDAFMDALSKQIAHQTNEFFTQQHVDAAHLKKDVLRFFELCINKLILPADNILESWKKVKDIANAFHESLKANIFTGETAFDDISWSLIHRFCYILQLTHKSITQEEYNQIMQEIRTIPCTLLQTEEQEKILQTKKEYLLQQLNNYKHLAHPREKKDYKLEKIMSSLQ